MITPELMDASYQERAREAAALRRQADALAKVERGSRPRRARSLPRFRGLPVPSFLAGRFRAASAP